MRYAIAIWNFVEPGVELEGLIDEFVDFGYDAVSFSSQQWTQWEKDTGRAVAEHVRRRGLTVTAHCTFADLKAEDARRLVNWFGDSLHAITFDPQMTLTSAGILYDAVSMMPVLARVLEVSAGTQIRVAVEDFPLDEIAVRMYEDTPLRRLMQDPRYGLLVDIGHLNVRLRGHRHYRDTTAAQYIEIAPVPIVEVHLHDNDGVKDQHAPIGSGNCDFWTIAGALKAAGFDGVSTIEIAPEFHGSTPHESKPYAKASLEKWKALLEE